jgi:hypothetical protein
VGNKADSPLIPIIFKRISVTRFKDEGIAFLCVYENLMSGSFSCAALSLKIWIVLTLRVVG